MDSGQPERPVCQLFCHCDNCVCVERVGDGPQKGAEEASFDSEWGQICGFSVACTWRDEESLVICAEILQVLGEVPLLIAETEGRLS